jgi:hypothetical protein
MCFFRMEKDVAHSGSYGSTSNLIVDCAYKCLGRSAIEMVVSQRKKRKDSDPRTQDIQVIVGVCSIHHLEFTTKLLMRQSGLRASEMGRVCSIHNCFLKLCETSYFACFVT